MKHTSHTRAVRFLSGLFHFFSIFIFINAFNFQHNPPSGWENQLIPNLNGRIVSDMEFTDSLNGYICADAQTINIASYLLRTTDGGENWRITDSLYSNLLEIQFLDHNVGYVCGAKMYKTTNAGIPWSQINLPGETAAVDMSVINEDTIWITDDQGLTGGIFLTTNGGASWTRKYYGGGFSNPDKIYFANSRLGFASRATNNYLRTSDGGESWQIINGPSIWFNDIEFIDSLTGYKANGYMMKTTDAGLTWNQQTLPKDTNFFVPDAVTFSWVKDTLWAVGANVFATASNQSSERFETRGIVFVTTNDGVNWGYQIPDTSYGIYRFLFVDFINGKKGWAYNSWANKDSSAGVFTNTGGDTTLYTGIREISAEIPRNFVLHQNFPNPFNPRTIIRFEVESKALINISVYDISGRSVTVLLNGELQPGTYETDFDGSSLPSGIYFCVTQSDSYKETITMALIK